MNRKLVMGVLATVFAVQSLPAHAGLVRNAAKAAAVGGAVAGTIWGAKKLAEWQIKKIKAQEGASDVEVVETAATQKTASVANEISAEVLKKAAKKAGLTPSGPAFFKALKVLQQVGPAMTMAPVAKECISTHAEAACKAYADAVVRVATFEKNEEVAFIAKAVGLTWEFAALLDAKTALQARRADTISHEEDAYYGRAIDVLDQKIQAIGALAGGGKF